MLDALARSTTARPWVFVVFAGVFVADALVIGAGVTDRLRLGGSIDPAAESTVAANLLDAHFPASDPNFVLLVQGRGGRGVDDPEVAQQGAQLAERLAFERDVVGVTSYWQTGAPELRSADGRSALILAHMPGDEGAVDRAFVRIAPRYRGHAGLLSVRVGGAAAIRQQVHATVAQDLTRSELIALPITLLVLVLVFGSPVAAPLPLAVGVVAILGTNAVLRVITQFTDVSVFAQNLTTGLGLGLAIDYALLIVRRYREELAGGAEPREAIAGTLRTAGRTVIFSGLTVAVSLSAMLLFPLYFLRSFAFAGISVVLLAIGAALLVLPPILVLLGRRVDALDLRRLLRERSPWAAGRRTEPGAGRRRLTTGVMVRAPLVVPATVAALVVVGLPFFRIQLGTADDRQLPASAQPRVVQDTIRHQFTSRPTGVVDVVAPDLPDPTAHRAALTMYAQRLSGLKGVSHVSTPIGTFRAGRLSETSTADSTRAGDGLSHLSVTPSASVEDISPQSQDLVRAIRREPNPFHATVAGQAAALVDSERAIADRLGLAAAIIAVTTLVLVFLLTGSLLVPVQAIVLNALSLTAMFGAVVWVFQEGHLSRLLGFTPTGYVETTLPVLMFCIAFGLSMDYGVFLLSRIKEEHDRTGDARAAVVTAMRRTGGVITAAALILSVILVAIGTSRITNTKMLGLGVALAVLVDATVVRCLLVPAVMSLSGRAAWWAPAPLRRFQRRFGLREEPGAAVAHAPLVVAAPKYELSDV